MDDFYEIDDVLLNSSEIETLFEYDLGGQEVQGGGMGDLGNRGGSASASQSLAASAEGLSGKTHSSLRRVVYNCRQNSALRSESFGLETPRSLSSRRASANVDRREDSGQSKTERGPDPAGESEATIECAICLMSLQDLLSCKGDDGAGEADGGDTRTGGGAAPGEAFGKEQRELLVGGLSVCKHIFCFVCIKQWSDVATQCPLCKREFDHINAYNIIPGELSIPVMVIPVETKKLNCNEMDEDPFADFACEVCRLNDHEEVLLLCDRCDRGYHTYCLDPPLDSVPSGEWFCPRCSRARRRRQNNRRNNTGRSSGGNLDADFTLDDDQDFVLELGPGASFQGRATTRSSRAERAARASRSTRSGRHLRSSSREGGPASSGLPAGSSISVSTATVRVVSIDSDSSSLNGNGDLQEGRSAQASRGRGGRSRRGRTNLSVVFEDTETDREDRSSQRERAAARPGRSGRARRTGPDRHNRSGVSRRSGSRQERQSGSSGTSILEMLDGAINISSAFSSEYVDLTRYIYQEESSSASIFRVPRNKSSSEIARTGLGENSHQVHARSSSSSSSLNGNPRSRHASRQSIQTSLDISNYRVPRETSAQGSRCPGSSANQASMFSGSQYSQSSGDESSIIELLESEEQPLPSTGGGSADHTKHRQGLATTSSSSDLGSNRELGVGLRFSPLFDSDENAVCSDPHAVSQSSVSFAGKLHIYGDASRSVDTRRSIQHSSSSSSNLNGQEDPHFFSDSKSRVNIVTASSSSSSSSIAAGRDNAENSQNKNDSNKSSGPVISLRAYYPERFASSKPKYISGEDSLGLRNGSDAVKNQSSSSSSSLANIITLVRSQISDPGQVCSSESNGAKRIHILGQERQSSKGDSQVCEADQNANQKKPKRL